MYSISDYNDADDSDNSINFPNDIDSDDYDNIVADNIIDHITIIYDNKFRNRLIKYHNTYKFKQLFKTKNFPNILDILKNEISNGVYFDGNINITIDCIKLYSIKSKDYINILKILSKGSRCQNIDIFPQVNKTIYKYIFKPINNLLNIDIDTISDFISVYMRCQYNLTFAIFHHIKCDNILNTMVKYFNNCDTELDIDIFNSISNFIVKFDLPKSIIDQISYDKIIYDYDMWDLIYNRDIYDNVTKLQEYVYDNTSAIIEKFNKDQKHMTGDAYKYLNLSIVEKHHDYINANTLLLLGSIYKGTGIRISELDNHQRTKNCSTICMLCNINKKYKTIYNIIEIRGNCDKIEDLENTIKEHKNTIKEHKNTIKNLKQRNIELYNDSDIGKNIKSAK